MDSGNSGSLQSSSGDEEYDSRADSISAALMTSHHHNHPTPPPAAPPLNPTNTSSIFDSLSNYFDPISRPPQNPDSSLLNLEMSWSTALRSNPNLSDINPNMVSASSIQSLFGSNQQQQGSFATTTPSVSIPSSVQENTSATNTPRQQAAPEQNNQAQVARNPKKRSRASRRAPTTVLTTDTTNFRAMVQEFTGIPAPPFTSSSPFQRPRLDLYGTSPSSMRSNNLIDSSQLQPPYLRRPFPQKVQLPPPFLASSASSCSSLLNSSLVDHAAIASPNSTSTNNNNTSGLNISTSTNPTFQLPLQSANLFNLPTPILTSLLQSNHVKYQPSNCPVIGSKTAQSLDEFGLGQGHVNTSSLSGLPGLISSDQTTSRNGNNPVNWGSSSAGVGSNDGGGDQGHQSRSGNGNFSLSRSVNGAGNGKLSYSGSSSGFHGEKGSSENVAVAVAPPPARGEGMMESWICSSD